MGHAFLSYSHRDRAVAERVAACLADAGIALWWDDKLKAGETFDEQLEAALRSATAVIVLWSKSSVASRWVRAEATVADRLGTIIPCQIEVCERPIIFELAHCLDLSDWRGESDHPQWASVVEDVCRRTGVSNTGLSALEDASFAHARSTEPILAVLAFDNLSPEPDLQYFSDGVAEEILSSMSRAAGIRVIGAASSFAFRGSAKADAARTLGASHILDGSVRRGGDRVRISARLTDAETGELLWTERFDRDLSDALAVQDEIAALTAQALEARLAPKSVQNAVHPQAYDLYLRALTERRSPDGPAQRRAISFLEAAIAIAPSFARAHSALAMALCHRIREATFADASSAAFDDALLAVRHAATRALDLDASDIEAPLALLSLQPVTENWASQDRMLVEALATNPADLALLWYRARWLAGTGRLRESIATYRKGYELNPLSPTWMIARSNGLFLEGDLAGAERLQVQAYAMAPADPYVWHARWSILCVMRRFDEAWKMVAEVPSAYGNMESAKAWMKAIEDPGPGTIEAYLATEIWDHRVDKFRVSQSIPAMALLGLNDAAFELLDHAMARVPAERLWCVWNGNNNGPGTEQLFIPLLAGLQADPRFMPLCHGLGLCRYWADSGQWPDFVMDSPRRAALEADIQALSECT